MNAAALSASGRRKIRTVMHALVLANLVVGVSVVLFFYGWQASVMDSARRDQELAVSNLAQSLSQTINADISLVDAGLKLISYQLEGNGRVVLQHAQALDDILRAQQELIPFVDALRLTDAQGRVMYGKGVDRQHPQSVANQRIFDVARSSRDADLLVSEPHISPLSHKWVLMLARRLELRDGSFAGMLYASVSADHFAELFSSVQMGRQGAISLRTASMQLVARVSTDQVGPVAIGSTKVSDELYQALRQAPLFGVYRSPTALDGIDRLNAYSRVLNFPLLVIAGQGLDMFQGAWLKQIGQIGFLCFLCILAVALTSTLAFGAIRRELFARDAMEREYERSRLLIDASSDGIHVLNDSGSLIQCNAMFAQMLGYRPDFLLGRALAFWTDLPSDVLAAAANGPAKQGPGRVEARYRKADGSAMDVELSFTQVESIQGRLTYCSARDITARKAVERTLLRESALLQAVGDGAHSAFLVVQHRSDSIPYFNHRFCVLWNLEHLEPALEAGKLTYSQVMLAMSAQLERPQSFMNTRQDLEDEAQSSTFQDTIAFTRGRMVRRFSAPVVAPDVGYVGRLYVFDEVLTSLLQQSK